MFDKLAWHVDNTICSVVNFRAEVSTLHKKVIIFGVALLDRKVKGVGFLNGVYMSMLDTFGMI